MKALRSRKVFLSVRFVRLTDGGFLVLWLVIYEGVYGSMFSYFDLSSQLFNIYVIIVDNRNS